MILSSIVTSIRHTPPGVFLQEFGQRVRLILEEIFKKKYLSWIESTTAWFNLAETWRVNLLKDTNKKVVVFSAWSFKTTHHWKKPTFTKVTVLGDSKWQQGDSKNTFAVSLLFVCGKEFAPSGDRGDSKNTLCKKKELVFNNGEKQRAITYTFLKFVYFTVSSVPS